MSNQRFHVNYQHLAEFRNIQAFEYMTPIIMGAIQIENFNIKEKKQNLALELILISRRDINRLGMRFWSRGADKVIY